jgi:hypothetical protein
MSLDVTELRAFYASPLGEVAQRLVGRTCATSPRGLA